MILRILVSFGLLTVCLAAQTASIATTSATASAARRALKDVDAKDIKLGEDEPGCKDSALLPRVAGCSIIQCDNKEADTLEIQVGVSTDGAAQKEAMDGNSEVIYYLCPSKVTLGNIVKTAEGGLTKAGFKVIFNGKDDDEQPIVTGLKDTQWVQVSTYMYNEYTAYIHSAIDVPADAQSASEALAEEMTKSGRVTLTGLNFEQEKYDMPADADKLLAEIAALLVRQPAWKIRIEAQSTELPNKQANVVLSQKRASAVATWLLDHGIDKSRVSIQGVDATDASQRIELIRF
jgi:outer membrane protein OmpA-like peptidoglycan-associated protein